MAKNNYYISALSWTIFLKVLTAFIGFFTTPLLLGVYGKADFGLLSIATACNGYMHLLDLGMNTGAVRYYSIWKVEGNINKIYSVARTNLTFYGVIAIVNILILLLIANFGEPFFSITHEQFVTLQHCLYILASFCIFSWLTTVYNQLLIADKQMTYSMKMNCLLHGLRIILLVCVFVYELSLTTYFFFYTLLVSSLIIPYSYKCVKDKLIDSFIPATFWGEFKPVLVFSLSIFALSLFQMSATHTRPIILSMFADDGASCVTDFSIISVFPNMIIMIGGAFSSVFLPKTSEMVANNDEEEMKKFAYFWTTRTTIIINLLTIPVILSSKELLCAYVGDEFSHLSIWLVLWCITVLIQMHTTPANALVLAFGRTKALVISSAIFCLISILLNVFLCPYFRVGSAIIAYGIYVMLVIGLYYIYYYKKLLHLERVRMISCFVKPTIISLFTMFLVFNIPFDVNLLDGIFNNDRVSYLVIAVLKTLFWIIPFLILIHFFKIENITNFFRR